MTTFLFLILGAALLAQKVPGQGPSTAGQGQKAPAASPATPSSSGPGDSAPRTTTYAQLMGKEAVVRKGVFTASLERARLLWEIPSSELGHEFLWTVRPAQMPSGADAGGPLLGHIVRFQRHEDSLYIREVSYPSAAPPKTAFEVAVEQQNAGGLLFALPILATSPNGGLVVDVTRLFLGSTALNYSPGSLDPQRSFVRYSRSYPKNVETEVTATFAVGGIGVPRSDGTDDGGSGVQASRSGALTYVLHYSLTKLPDTPMQGRLADERVGYFVTHSNNYGEGEVPVERTEFIERWRLEKKDPNASMSEPVAPIVFYLDPAIPKRFVPYAKKAVLAWNAAFEEAGFRNAIVVREPPTSKEDPEWVVEDARYNVIRWLPSDKQNAIGPILADPRSGEILRAQVFFYQNLLQKLETSYLITAGSLDPRVQALPFPEDLQGELVQYALTHEVGHTLGLQHNMLASAMYPESRLHDANWLHNMGYAASIMDYARFNYVAQPEDRVDVHDLIPRLGPYDRWAIHWGYATVRGALSAAEEKPVLNQWSSEQVDRPELRFLTEAWVGRGIDPEMEVEVVGDQDSVAATEDGLKSLLRTLPLLLRASTTHSGSRYEPFKELYKAALNQRQLELDAVARMVGGIRIQNLYTGEGGEIFRPESKERQQQAVRLLMSKGFVMQPAFLTPEILRVIGPVGVTDFIESSQTDLLRELMQPAKLNRMEDMLRIDPHGYEASALVNTLHRFVFRELTIGAMPRLSPERRTLQTAYVDVEADLMRDAKGAAAELYIDDRKRLLAELQRAQPRAQDAMSRAHLIALTEVLQRDTPASTASGRMKR